MPLRNRIVITVIAALAAAGAIVPLIMNLVRAGDRQQVIITIPTAAANSPLPYSTPFPRLIPSVHTATSAGVSTSQPAYTSAFSGLASSIVKLKKPGDGTVDINTAPLIGLERLPGIGPAMAARIVAKRSELGRFNKPTDLLEVRGIGPKKYAKVEPFLSVN